MRVEMELIAHMVDIFAQIDRQVTAFQLKTGLRCPTGCGLCCPAADVQTTAVEMLPAAHEILCRGESSVWIDRIRMEGLDGTCVFYRRQSISDVPGHCEMYPLRPMVCRLFGFAAVRDRLGAPKLSVCKHLKNSDPDLVARASDHQNEAPRFADFGISVLSLDATGAHLIPINAALDQAIMRLGLIMQMAHGEVLGITSAA
jgi:uncharacterized protein